MTFTDHTSCFLIALFLSSCVGIGSNEVSVKIPTTRSQSPHTTYTLQLLNYKRILPRKFCGEKFKSISQAYPKVITFSLLSKKNLYIYFTTCLFVCLFVCLSFRLINLKEPPAFLLKYKILLRGSLLFVDTY